MLLLSIALAAISSVKATASLVLPASGTAIQPGAQFAFKYSGAGDYCVSSYNYSVFLYTKLPTSFNQTDNYASGFYFGTFSSSNVPTSLTTPDFSKSLGGFGNGKSASNAPVWLAVQELYSSCTAAFGGTFGLHVTQLIYNSTTPAKPKYQIKFNGNNDLCVQTQGLFANSEVFLGGCNSLDSNYYSINRGPTGITVGGTNFSLDAGSAPKNGSPLRLKPKDSSEGQNWYYTDDNRIAIAGSGLCLDLPSGNTQGGTRLQMYKCSSGNTNQVWTLSQIP